MFPVPPSVTTVFKCLPHAGGGVSCFSHRRCKSKLSSPRRWGCFCYQRHQCGGLLVFPTQVGVFPGFRGYPNAQVRLPHAGGGVSFSMVRKSSKLMSSPRRWGCFRRPSGIEVACRVFPTQVGVFPGEDSHPVHFQSLPHAGGGVSNLRGSLLYRRPSSPRRWGCFCKGMVILSGYDVFPTQVGVFLLHGVTFAASECLPHAGGGVSTDISESRKRCVSSPRRWGCFPPEHHPCGLSDVFPTQVGVFPESIDEQGQPLRLPHAGGGCFLFNRIP